MPDTPDTRPDETPLAAFRADKRRFFSIQIFWVLTTLAVALFVGNLITSGQNLLALMGVVLIAQVFAVMMGYRRVFSVTWYLTDRRLIGPRGRSILLLEIQKLIPFLGDVQIINNDGRRFRIEHLADAQEAITQIEAACQTRDAAQ